MTAARVQRLRLAAVSLALVFVVFAQGAGNTVADTKIDLVVDPMRFLTRALRLWDPIGNGGQLQNQAYGYLFPMGPLFAIGHEVGLAPWVTQRAFEAAIVLGGFLGTVRLSRLLGVPGFWPRVAAALAYALAPRTLSELTSISAELMPVAALPWVMIPLVSGARGGSTRRAGLRSGVALLFAGGVNAAATVAILPVPALWLLTRRRSRRTLSLAAWWVVGTALSCLWWAIPLVLLGRYSPPFLDWIESASATTVPTSLLAALRGTDQWVAYLGPQTWPGGWVLAAAPLVIVATTAVAAAGLAGLARRRAPHRVFLVSTLLVGLVLLTFGHLATIGPPGALSAQRLLDGALVPFRNVHKFDPMVRLPLAVGLGHLLARQRLPAWRLFGRWLRLPVRALATVAAVGVFAVAITPAVTGQLATKQRVTTEPGWWRQTASWLAANAADGRALVVPGSSSPAYVWGSTVDDALQPVATTPWALRNAVPLAPAGYIRLLDRVEDSLSAGRPDPTLAPLLRRSGITTVVLRNDLSSPSSQATSLSLVRATLDGSPGLRVAAGFGPQVSGNDRPNNLIDLGLGDLRPSVQVYRVDGAGGLVAIADRSDVPTVSGSADDLPTLLAAGLPADRPVLFTPDAPRVVTDGIRRRQASFGSLLTASPTMAQGEPYAGRRAAYDYLPADPGPLSAWQYGGIDSLSASSSGADLLAFLNRNPAHGVWSAVDGDAGTAWESGSLGGAVGQWLQLTTPARVDAATATVRFADGLGDWPTQVLVSTDTGFRYNSVQPGGQPQPLLLPPGGFTRLRITVTAMASGGRGGSVGVAQLEVPGLTPTRSLVVGGTHTDPQLAFAVAPGRRATCLTVHGQPACDPTFTQGGEEDDALARTVTLSGPTAAYTASARVRLLGGPALDRLLDSGRQVVATASSVEAADPRVRPGAAVDGDPQTTWVAATGDAHPRLTLTLPSARPVRGLTMTTSEQAPVARPARVTVQAGAATWHGTLPADGRVAFDRPARARRLVITVETGGLRSTTSSLTFRTRLLTVGVSEVSVDAAGLTDAAGLPEASTSSDLDVPCASGPRLDVDGVERRLRVVAPRADVLSGAAVPARLCPGPALSLGAGSHRIRLASTELVAPQSLSMSPLGQASALETTGSAAAPSESVVTWGSTSRAVRVSTAAPAVLVVRESSNPGWTATLHGNRLAALQVDGWQQAFAVPGGANGVVRLQFAPQRSFTIGLLVGAAAVLALLLGAVGWRRRPEPEAETAPQPAASRDRGEVRLPVGVGAGLSGAALFALTGWAGPVTLGVLGVACVAVWSWRRGLPSWFGVLTLVVASALVASVPSYSLFVEANSNRTQLLCVAALAAVCVGDGARRRRRAP